MQMQNLVQLKEINIDKQCQLESSPYHYTINKTIIVFVSLCIFYKREALL